MQLAIEIFVLLTYLIGSLAILITAIAFFRVRDAVSRINAAGPATALGVPLLTIGSVTVWLSRNGFNLMVLLEGIVVVGAFLIVSTIGSNVLARAAYLSGAPLAEDTEPNDLAGSASDELS
ncbi:MAG: cation:proton antiporter [Arachnia propionica]|nr:MAG: cation:proton antiporter [Arachnia propionica]